MTQNKLQPLVDSLLLFFIACIVLGFYLGGHPLVIPDEGRYCEVAREMLARHDFITPYLNGVLFFDKPILYYWLQMLAMHLLGMKAWVMRIWPLLFAYIGMLATYLFGRLFFDRQTGWMAAAILLLSPLYFGSAHYANMDLEVAVWITLSLYCLMVVLFFSWHRYAPLCHFLAYVFMGFAVLTKGLMGIVFPVMVVGLWICLHWRWDLVKKLCLIRGTIYFLMITLPWFILIQHRHPSFFHYFFITQQVTRFISQHFNAQQGAWFYIVVILLGMFPWSFWLIAAAIKQIRERKIKDNQAPLVTFLWLWFLVILIFFSIPKSKIAGYILPVFAPCALLCANYFRWRLTTTLKRMDRIIVLLLFALGLAAFVFWLGHPLFQSHLSHLKGYFFLMTCCLLVMAVFALFALWRHRLSLFLVPAALLMLVILLLTSYWAVDFGLPTTKPLLDSISGFMTPKVSVVSYFDYHQDLPFYLKHTIIIINNWQDKDIASLDDWQREFYWGAQLGPHANTLWLPKTFWQWHIKHPKKQVVVFLQRSAITQFRQQTTQRVTQLGCRQSNCAVLLS